MRFSASAMFASSNVDSCQARIRPGLDIGYVPAGPHALFFLVLRMPPLFLLGIGKTRKATLIRTYFFVIYRPNVQKCATSRVKS